MKKINFLLITCLIGTALASSLPKEEIKEISWFDQVHSLRGHFKQKSSAMGRNRAWSGHFFFKMPSLMRWATYSPHRQEIVADGQSVWFYDIALSTVMRYPQEYFSHSAIVRLFSKKDREIYFQSKLLYRSPNSEHWEFQSKEGESEYSRLKVYIEKNILSHIEIYDQFNNYIQINFIDIQLNQFIDSKNFLFEVPEGVELLEATHKLD